MKQEVMPPFILSASLPGRAGIWLHGRANRGSCTSQPSARVSTRWIRDAQRHWAGGSRELETRAHITNASCCAAGQSPPELLWLIPWEGTEAPLILALNFLLSLLTFCQSCFQGNLSPSLQCCQVGVVGNEKNTLKPTAQIWVFCLGFWEFKKRIVWLCCWVSTGWMWFLSVISVVKLYTELWCLICQWIKACCYARNGVMALCGLLGIAKMVQKYQEEVESPCLHSVILLALWFFAFCRGWGMV